jgi:Uncharacterized conserved protein
MNETAKSVCIKEEFIKLDSFLKLSGAAETGGQAKILILDELVKVNGKTCIQRGKKIYHGDTVMLGGKTYVCDKAEI